MVSDPAPPPEPVDPGMVRHFTATGYVVNPTRTRMLLIHHRKLGLWLPPGGHLEANEVPHHAALREVCEETGVRARLIPSGEPLVGEPGTRVFQLPRPWAMLHENIPATPTEPAHVHLDLCYLLQADDHHPLHAQEGEVSGVRWWDRDAITATTGTDTAVQSFAGTHLR